MNLDGFTLMVAGSFVAALSGLLLLVAWTQMRAPALLWWSVANGIYAVGIGTLAIGITGGSALVMAVASGITALPPVLVFGGVRRFNQRPNRLLLLAAGPAVWVAAGAIPFPGGAEFPATVAFFAIWTIYMGAAVAELWRGRGEYLAARWPLAGFFTLHALIFLAGMADSVATKVTGQVIRPLSIAFSTIHFEALIYIIGTSVFLVLMCKERSERQHIIASRSDSLTGIANRGALLESGERSLRRCQTDGKSFSLIIFDLDHFKWVNDNFGHAADEVIRAFASTTQTILRPNDLFGRYGGEEFVVVLPGATIEAAYVIADRIRNGFAAASVVIGDAPVKCTVSAGIASANSAAITLEAIIRAADECLYQAKELGRNRVERPAKSPDKTAASTLIRVA